MPAPAVKSEQPVQPRVRRRRWPWILGTLFVVWIGVLSAVWIVVTHAEPIVRARVIETLSARFKTKVELAELHVSAGHGLEVYGKGLKIFGPTDPNPTESGVQPLIAVEEFRFRTNVLGLLHSPMHLDAVSLRGMILNIPPKEDRSQVAEMNRGRQGKIKIVVDHFVCQDAHLIINTLKPGKLPLDFAIGDLMMKDFGPGQPLRFQATLVNPKPVGNIASEGTFGPFREDQPGDTAVAGNYSFTEADLGTLKGIGGILSSSGNYRGTLEKIEVDGATDTPDFRVATSGHPVALHTDFHAIVDGMDGDTYLQPVKASFLHSVFTANGKVVRVSTPPGRDIELDVVMTHARIEDLLQLGVKTDPPVLRGEIQMKTKLRIFPGREDIAHRLRLDGTFRIPEALFSNQKIQDRIDSLSLRSQGEPKLAVDHAEVGIPSELGGSFKLSDGLFQFPALRFDVPGTQADVTGQYSLDGEIFDFHGRLRLKAKLSQTMTGWKSILLKPVDPFFHKHGAGTEVPFKVTGTRSEPHFGLDFGDKRQLPSASASSR